MPTWSFKGQSCCSTAKKKVQGLKLSVGRTGEVVWVDSECFPHFCVDSTHMPKVHSRKCTGIAVDINNTCMSLRCASSWALSGSYLTVPWPGSSVIGGPSINVLMAFPVQTSQSTLWGSPVRHGTKRAASGAKSYTKQNKRHLLILQNPHWLTAAKTSWKISSCTNLTCQTKNTH